MLLSTDKEVDFVKKRSTISKKRREDLWRFRNLWTFSFGSVCSMKRPSEDLPQWYRLWNLSLQEELLPWPRVGRSGEGLQVQERPSFPQVLLASEVVGVPSTSRKPS